jgi:REP element-mobilizing transposase RayT
LRTYDYSTPGYYFVTICVKNRLPLLGRIADGVMRPSRAGAMVDQVWGDLPDHYPGVEVDAWIVMPNHVHGIVVIHEPTDTPDSTRLSLLDVMQRFKSLTTARYIAGVKEQGWPPFPRQLWQTSYFERVIRGDRELDEARRYIADNVAKWALDRENPDRLR